MFKNEELCTEMMNFAVTFLSKPPERHVLRREGDSGVLAAISVERPVAASIRSDHGRDPNVRKPLAGAVLCGFMLFVCCFCTCFCAKKRVNC